MYIEPNTQVCLQNLEMRRFTRQLKSVLRHVASENCSSWTELATLVKKIDIRLSIFFLLGWENLRMSSTSTDDLTVPFSLYAKDKVSHPTVAVEWNC